MWNAALPRSVSQVTLRASRPAIADHVSVASTATPEGIRTTSTTPGIDRAYLSSIESTLAPKWSGRRTIAISSPGRRTSSAYLADPVVLATESSRGRRLPISFQSFGSLSATSLGTGTLAASAASSPNVAERCDRGCETTPFATAISSAGTPQLDAAAVASMIRAAAPTLRICSQELDSEVLPPVSMCGPNARLL